MRGNSAMHGIEVFYSPAQVSSPTTASPGPQKPAWVIADWQEHGLPILLRTPEPATCTQIAMAHDPDYVIGVLDCTLPNGFGSRERCVAESLPWTVGSFISAARHSLDSGIACSPTAGFHHAHYASGNGYCTFNGLMVAAMLLKREGKVRRIGILDCDQHFGDGTADIMDELAIGWIKHVSRDYGIHASGSKFLESTLPALVRNFSGSDLLIYQAGADQHINDQLGGFLTTAELMERDRIVFSIARKLGVPVVWNLAGGYQTTRDCLLEIHRNTMQACISEYMPTYRLAVDTPEV